MLYRPNGLRAAAAIVVVLLLPLFLSSALFLLLSPNHIRTPHPDPRKARPSLACLRLHAGLWPRGEHGSRNGQGQDGPGRVAVPGGPLGRPREAQRRLRKQTPRPCLQVAAPELDEADEVGAQGVWGARRCEVRLLRRCLSSHYSSVLVCCALPYVFYHPWFATITATNTVVAVIIIVFIVFIIVIVIVMVP